MSYGRIQRQPNRRAAGPYDRPSSNAHSSSSAAQSSGSSSSVPFFSRIFDSLYGLFRPSHYEHTDVVEKPAEVPEPPNPVANSAPEPPEPSPDVKWFGTPIREMTYGELRRVCSEEGLKVSENRDVMLNALRQHIISQRNNRAPESQNKRRLSNDDASLDHIMSKKAKVGFSKDEFEKYMTLMKDNLKFNDADIGRFSPGSPTKNSSRELRRQSLPKRVPTPFAHLSSRRPSRRDSLSGRGTTGPIHLSFPETVTSTDDIHDLSNSSKTARSIFSSISSMSTPLIQSNEVLAKKRLQPRKPFNPYAQVGPPPRKPAFKVQPPIPKPSGEPVKVNHEFGDDGVLKKPRTEAAQKPAVSPPAPRPQTSVSQQPKSDISKKAQMPSAAPPVPSKPAPVPVAPTPPAPKASPATAFSQPSEEALCPVCEMPLDDVDHSDCKTGESSSDQKPSPSLAPSFTFGKILEPSVAPNFSFQLPKFPESGKPDEAPSFSFAPPSTVGESGKSSLTTSKSADVTPQTKAPPSPPKFFTDTPSFKKQAMSNSADSLPKQSPPSSGGVSTGSMDAMKPFSFGSQVQKAANESSATPSTVPASSNLPGSIGLPSQTDSAKDKRSEPAPSFTFSSESAPFKFGGTSNQEKASEPASFGSAGFKFGTTTPTPAAPEPITSLKGDSTQPQTTSLASGSEPKFDFKPKEPSQPTFGAMSTNSSGSTFQFGAASGQSPAPFQFGASSTGTAAVQSTSTTTGPSSTSTTFQFAPPSSTPAPASQPAFSFDSAKATSSSTPAPPSSAPAFSFDLPSTAPSAPAASSAGFSFGVANSSSTANPPSTGFSLGMSDSKPDPTPSFSFGAPSVQTPQASTAMEQSSAMATNNISTTPTPFVFNSSMSTPSAGFGQGLAPTGSVFGQSSSSTPSTGFGFTPNTKPAISMDGFQSGSGFQFGQMTPSAAQPTPSFSFGSSTPSTASFPGAINFDAPVPENLSGSFSHGIAPQGRPMVKAKRVARKR